MVTKGQLLERPVVIPAAAGCLDGIYLRGGAPPLLVCSPLPSRGGSMASPVGTELAYAAAYAGCASLRLDYRGVGASEGEPSPALADAGADLREGASFLLESADRADGRLAVAGHLSGCWAALWLARHDPRVDRVLLVCPEREDEPADVPTYEEVDAPVLVLHAGHDPALDLGRELERIEAANNARQQVIPGATRSFREALAALAREVGPFLGKGLRE